MVHDPLLDILGQPLPGAPASVTATPALPGAEPAPDPLLSILESSDISLPRAGTRAFRRRQAPAGDDPLLRILQGGPAAPTGPVSTGFASQFAGSVERIVPDVNFIRALLASGFGDDVEAQRLAELAVSQQSEIARERPRVVPRVEDIDDLGSFATFASETLGEGAGFIATSILGGGLGGILGRLVARGVLPQAAAKLVARKFAQRGVTAGVVATSSVLNTGETANRLFESTGELQPGVALPVGLVKGALDAIGPGYLIRKFGFGDDLAGNFINRFEQELGKKGLRGFTSGAAAFGAGEAVTETLQEAADAAAESFVSENFDVLSAEQTSNFLNAAAAGLLVGGIFGGAAGAVTGPSAQPQSEATDAELRRAAGLRTESDPPRPGPSAVAAPSVDTSVALAAASPAAPPVSSLRNTTAITPVAAGIEPTVRFGESNPGDFQITGLEPFNSQLIANLPPVGERTARVRIGNAPVLLTPEAAQRTLVTETGGPSIRGAQLQQVDISQVDPAQLTLYVEDIPVAEGRAIGRASFVEGVEASAQTEALDSLTRAVQVLRGLRRETAQGTARNTLQPQLRAAQEAYQRAIDLGLRIVPRGDESAQIARGVAPVGVPITELPPGEGVAFRLRGNIAPDTLSPGANTIAVSAEGAFVRDVDARIGVPRFAPRTQRARDANFTEDFDLFRRTTRIGIETAAIRGQNAKVQEIQRVFRFQGEPLTPQQAEELSQRDLLQPEVFNTLLDEGFRVPSLAAGGLTFVPEPGTALNILPDDFIEVPGRITTKPEETIFARRGNSIAQYFGQPAARIGQKLEEFTQERAETTPAGTLLIVGKQIKSILKGDQGYPNLKEDLPGALRIVEQFLKRVMPKQRIVLTLQERDSRGAYTSMEGEYGQINISPSQIESKFDLVRVLTHEFGHMMAHKMLQAQGSGVVERMYRAYDRSLLAARQRGAQVPLAIFSPTRLFSVLNALQIDQTIAETIQDPTVDAETKRWLDYATSFDEWFAEQVAKWATTNTAPLSIIQTFFRDFAATMKRLARDVGKRLGLKLTGPEAFRPEAVVEEFLNSTLENWRKPNVLPVGPLAQLGAVSDSITEHTAAYGDDAPPGGARADSASSEPPNRVLDRAPPSPIQRKRRKAENARYNWFIKHAWGILQLAQKNPTLRGLQTYVSQLSQWYNRKMQWMVRANERLREWQGLGPEMAGNLGEFLFRLDQFGIVEKRFPTDEEFIALAREHKLSSEALEVYERVKGDFAAVLDHMERVTLAEAAKISDPLVQAARIQEIQNDFAGFRSRPYFPHSRFGKFVLVVKRQGVTEYMEAFEDKKARDNAFAAVRAQFPKSQEFTIRRDVLPDEIQALRILPPSMLKMMRDKLQLSGQQQTWFDELLFQFAPAQSFRKRMASRDNVPGFSTDAPRAYANYFFHGANHFARIEFSGPLQDAINAVNAEIESITGVDEIDLDKLRGIRDFMEDHFNNSLYSGGDWAAVRSVAFTWHIGLVPASAFVNLSQVPMVTLPYLAARFQGALGRGRSDAAAAGAIVRAYKDIRSLMTRPERLSEQDARLLARAVNEGFIDESFAAELAGLSEGNYIRRLLPGSRTGRIIRDAGYVSSWLFQNAEKINRRVTFRAAIDLALKNPEAEYLTELRERFPDEIASLQRNGFSPAESVAFLAGRDAVLQTQFEYAAWAQPRFMRGPVKRTVFTFYAFLQNMLWFAQNSPGRGRYLLLMLSIAGLQGLPGAEDIEDFVRFAARQMNIDFNPEKEIREFLIELDVNPDLILRGVSRTGFGLPQVADMFGVPFPEIDLSRRIGLGQVVPGVEAINEGEFDRIIARGTTDVLGASFAIGFNAMQALSDDHPDIYKRWERALPSSLRNVSKAWRFNEEGRERTRAGETILEFDPADPRQQAEIAMQALGFQPTRLAEQWDRLRLQQEVIRYWSVRKNILLARFRHAQSMKDKVLKREVLASVKRYNARVPDATMKIGRDSLRRSVQGAARRRRRFEAGLPRTRFGTQTAREIERLFPDDPNVVAVEDVR